MILKPLNVIIQVFFVRHQNIFNGLQLSVQTKNKRKKHVKGEILSQGTGDAVHKLQV